MGQFKFEELYPKSRTEVDDALRSDNPQLIARTLISMGLHDEDWRWVQAQALKYLSHENDVVVSAAILSLAHTARVNHSIDRSVVIPALQSVAIDSRYTGKVQDALDDIEMFVRGDISP